MEEFFGRLNEFHKKYKEKTAVNSLDLSIEEGELFSLLGVNGAGKTTTIRMLTCLSTPTAGEAYICGHSTAKERLVRLSYSSFTAPPKAMSPHIRQALVTEGEKPVTPAKNSSNGTETRKVSHLRPRNSR